MNILYYYCKYVILSDSDVFGFIFILFAVEFYHYYDIFIYKLVYILYDLKIFFVSV